MSIRIAISAAIVGSLMLWGAAPAHAAYVTGNDLMKRCLSDRNQDILACTHYIAGVIDYHTLLQSLGTAPTVDFCLPESISMDKAALIVMAYLRSAPQHQAFVAATAVPMALNKVFPCAKAQGKRKKK